MQRGCFTFATNAFFNPRDPQTRDGLLFDIRSWTTIPSVPAHIFRAHTCDILVGSSQPTTVSTATNAGPLTVSLFGGHRQ